MTGGAAASGRESNASLVAMMQSILNDKKEHELKLENQRAAAQAVLDSKQAERTRVERDQERAMERQEARLGA